MSTKLVGEISLYRKNPKKSEFFVIEGLRAVEQARLHGENPHLFATPGFISAHNDFFAASKSSVTQISSRRMKSLSNTCTPPGILGLLPKKKYSLDSLIKKRRLFLLEKISDPGNLGTMLRSFQSLDIDCVFLSPGCVYLYNPKVVRASLSAICTLPFYCPSDWPGLIRNLKNEGFLLTGTSPRDGTTLDQYCFSGRDAVLIGSESHGLSSESLELCSGTLHIPQKSGMESLNAAIAASIVAYRLMCYNLTDG